MKLRLTLTLRVDRAAKSEQGEPYREVDMGAAVERAEQPRMLGFQREDADTLERGRQR